MKKSWPNLKKMPSWLAKVSPWQWVAVFSMIFLWAVILLPSSPVTPTPKPTALGEEHMSSLERVNAHLQYIEQQAELRELEARNKIPEPKAIDPSSINPLPQFSGTEYQRFKEDDQAERVYEDLRGSKKGFDTPLTPEERINAALANKRWLQDYEENQKNEYIRNFIENARSQGYEVELNDQLEVVNIREIPTNKRFRGIGSIKKLDF